MKKFDFRKISTTIVVLLFLVSCEGIFIPDPIDPRLPKYTEDGNGAAGALVNDEVWKSIARSDGSDEPHIDIWKVQDSITLGFSGDTNDKAATIEFHLTGLGISKFEDFVLLQGKKIQLDGIKNVGYYFTRFNDTPYENKGIGQIYLKNVKLEKDSLITISGTFGFSFNDSNGNKTNVSYGRFDYNLDNSRFFIRSK